MQEFGFCENFMNGIVKGLQTYPERYPNAVIRSGRISFIDVEMMFDWIKYRDALSAKVPVPPFRREDYQ
jgi:hypothetical protein